MRHNFKAVKPDLQSCKIFWGAGLQEMELQAAIDDLYRRTFESVALLGDEGNTPQPRHFTDLTEARFGALGREEPQACHPVLSCRAASFSISPF